MTPRSLAAWLSLVPLLALLAALGGQPAALARAQLALAQQGLAADSDETRGEPARRLFRLTGDRATAETPRRQNDPRLNGGGSDSVAAVLSDSQASSWVLAASGSPAPEGPAPARKAALGGGGPRAPPSI